MVDEKDKQILFELLQNCRQPLSKIAKYVKLPQQTTSYRIKKLEKDKAIKKYTINLNYPKLGYSRHSLYLDLKRIGVKEVEKYLKQITGIQEVSCCYMLHGVSEWKIYISIWAKTIERYDDIQTKIITKFKKNLVNYLSFQSVKSYTYFARRLNPKKKASVDIKSNPEHIELKNIDWKIIKILKKDSRTSALEIASQLKTNANTITRRIRELQKKEIIERFYPILDMNKLGYSEYTFISRIDPSRSKDLEKFIEYAKKDSRFNIIIKAVGYVNLYYAFLVENSAEFKEIREKIELLLGKAILQEYKIEVEDMIS
jgi:DNA-binding Lrp family transcriptional regulator